MFKKKENRGKWSKKKKATIIIIGIIILSLIGLWFLLPEKTNAQLVSTGEVTLGYIEEAVSINGTIEGADKAEVMSSSNYEISEILVDEGDKVVVGQILAKLNDTDLQIQYAKAYNALKISKTKYENAKILYDEGAISKEELNQNENAYNNDVLTVRSYNISNKTTIKSPIDGIVTRINAVAGKLASSVTNQGALFVIEDLDNLKMNVKVSEFDISRIKIGQKVHITAQVIGDDILLGEVEKIAPTGEIKDQISKEMIIPVTISVEKKDSNVISGVSAKASILINSKEKAIIVPIDAIIEDPVTGETSIAIVMEDNTIKIQKVNLGIEGTFNIEIISESIKAGDMVVLNPGFELETGMLVEVENEGGNVK